MNEQEEMLNPEVAAASIIAAHEYSDLSKLNPGEKAKLVKMLKKDNEFSLAEKTMIKLLMGEVLNLEELGLVMGLMSKRTGGKPMSKVAAKKETDRIVGVVAKRAKNKLGIAVDLNDVNQKMKDMKAADVEKAKQQRADKRALKKRTAAAVKDYEQTKRELQQLRKDMGLPP